ncbi:DedA family protein [Solicola gregarius]|uniref:DedA family protein n=1 Tax=Solicola gregarius TaxID=2908642 RepID=A0AA46YL97_9ACTN|nr:DedA family protein [Solicola gregarius]UYM06690.1 DedA family protein [Solicola gregarius]
MLGLQSVPVAMAAAYGFAFAESGLGLGMVLPGETAVVAIAATVDGPVATLLVFAAVSFGACSGDHVGYWLGRTQGDRIRRSRAVARVGTEHWDRAMDLLRRHGATAVFLTRMLPLVRTLTPAAAGSSGLAYARFLPASLSGSMLWAAVYVGGGNLAVTTARATYDRIGPATWWLVATAAIAATAWAVWRHRPTPIRYPVLLRAGAPRPHHSDLAAAPDLSLTGQLQP